MKLHPDEKKLLRAALATSKPETDTHAVMRAARRAWERKPGPRAIPAEEIRAELRRKRA